MAQKLTLQDALNYPANYIYIWADDRFLSQLDAKSATTIKNKGMNQRRLVYDIAKADGNPAKWTDYVQQIRTSFINKYGMKPAEALVVLASGGEVKGLKGISGIGSTPRSNFASNTSVSVDPETGVISLNGTAQNCTPVYGKNGAVSNQNCVINGVTYSSIYDKSSGKYYAYQACNSDGVKYNADGQQLLVGSLTNSMWQDIQGIAGSIWEWIEKILDYIFAHFGTGTNNDSNNAPTPTKEKITPENTTPSQKDGFIFDAKTDLGILAIAGAAVVLLATRKRKKD